MRPAAGGNLRVEALNGSPAAGDLGLLPSGTGATLEGFSISDGSSDIRITLTNGTPLGVDLSGLARVQDVLDAINDAHPAIAAVECRARRRSS